MNIITKKFKIGGMHCTSCAMNIDFDLEELNGVKSSKTNYAKQVTEVVFDPQSISIKDIISVISKLNYIARIESE